MVKTIVQVDNVIRHAHELVPLEWTVTECHMLSIQ